MTEHQREVRRAQQGIAMDMALVSGLTLVLISLKEMKNH